MTLSCLKFYTVECASSWNFCNLFLFPSNNMLVQCTNPGLFPFYQYTCKLLSSKVTSEVLFKCLFIFALSCMVIPNACCCCGCHFHSVCQCHFILKNVCVWFSLISFISKYLCGWFSSPWILVTISAMGGVVIKGMGAVALGWSIPEVRNENFPLLPLTI